MRRVNEAAVTAADEPQINSMDSVNWLALLLRIAFSGVKYPYMGVVSTPTTCTSRSEAQVIYGR